MHMKGWLTSSLKMVYLLITVVNLMVTMMKVQSNRLHVVSACLLDFNLCLVGLNLVHQSSVEFSVAVMFVIVFGQYYTLALTILEAVIKHGHKVTSLCCPKTKPTKTLTE